MHMTLFLLSKLALVVGIKIITVFTQFVSHPRIVLALFEVFILVFKKIFQS